MCFADKQNAAFKAVLLRGRHNVRKSDVFKEFHSRYGLKVSGKGKVSVEKIALFVNTAAKI